jgi:hypothetical protein
MKDMPCTEVSVINLSYQSSEYEKLSAEIAQMPIARLALACETPPDETWQLLFWFTSVKDLMLRVIQKPSTLPHFPFTGL